MKKILLSVGILLTVTAADAQTRYPLYEVFTSSTCGPCYNGNAVYEGVVASKPATDYVCVKYQQDFPSTGDPYCTNESVARRSYYAINSIPRMEIDGAWDQNAQSFTNALYTSSKANVAKYSIAGTWSIKNKVVTAKFITGPLVAGIPAGAVLYVAILETRDTANKKTNGETQFFNVMKKMLPTQTGTQLFATAVNQKDTTNLTFTFAGNYRLPANGQVANRIDHTIENSVEHFENLKMVAWVQGATTKEVYQANNTQKVAPVEVATISNTINEVNMYPNPSSSSVNVDINMSKSDMVSASIISMSGATVATKTVSCTPGKNQVTFNTQELANGVYNFVVLDSKNSSFTQRLFIVH